MANIKKISKVNETVNSMDLRRLSDEEIEGAFRSAFEDSVVYNNDFGGETDFDVRVSRDLSKNIVKIEATIQGLAGSVNAEDFKKGKVKQAEKIVGTIETKGKLVFVLLPKETMYNSSTEYTIVYQIQ
jgi:hypothetical protein